MDSKKTIGKELWSKVSRDWANGVAPWRPSRDEIKIYEECLQAVIHKRGNDINVLIYGATPELRDLLARYGIKKVTLVDINPDMIKAMSELVTFSEGKEKVEIASWLETPFKDGQFDLVLCDQGIHYIYFEDWNKFFGEQARLLKKGGFLIEGIVAIEKKEIITVEKMLNIYKNNIFTREDKFYYAFRVAFGLKDFEGREYYKDLSGIRKQIQEHVGKNLIDKDDADFFDDQMFDFKGVLSPKEAVDETVAEHFNIKSIQQSFVHPVFTCYKIYFGEVRK